jgi:hypothetical protein
MKTLIAILALVAALLTVNSIQAQTITTTDSIELRIIQRNVLEINSINLRLENFVRQNKRANGFFFFGAIVGGIGAYAMTQATDQYTLRNATGVVALGTLLSATGVVIRLDSFNRLNRKPIQY